MVKNRGITLVSLIITIIILLILAGTTVYIVDKVTKTVKIENIKTNMLLIQAQIKTIKEKHKFDETNNPLKGTEVTIDTSKYGVASDKKYYLLGEDDLKEMKLDNIEYDNGYYVCYDTEEVIYIRGLKNNNGDILYTLTQMKENNK